MLPLTGEFILRRDATRTGVTRPRVAHWQKKRGDRHSIPTSTKTAYSRQAQFSGWPVRGYADCVSYAPPWEEEGNISNPFQHPILLC